MTDAAASLGTLQRHGDSFELRFTRDFAHEPAALWRAITDPDSTRRWWAETVVDLRVGGEWRVRWLNGEDGGPLEWLSGRIVELEPERLVEFTNEAHGVLRWQLEPIASGTRLVLVNTVAPPEPRFVTMSLAGWHVHLEHLSAVLDGSVVAIDWPHWYRDHFPRWQRLHAAYQESTGLD
jgi:uncharacterized protein YndB with AHSA1/START domain